MKGRIRKGGKPTEDAEIVQLYWDRNELAIPATSEKYGSYCRAIAGNILGSREDAEECVNDTYLRAWNSIPPSRPGLLSAYLGKITRNLALNRYRYHTAEKRGGGEVPLVLAEIAELVSDTDGVEQEMDRRALAEAVSAFLAQLPAERRRLFVRRYWYLDGVAQIAAWFGMTENQVSVTLSRLRAKLKDYLVERGFTL